MESTKDAAIPTRLFSSIIPNLITVLEHTQRAEGVVTPQAKQALLQAVRGVLILTSPPLFTTLERRADKRPEGYIDAGERLCHRPPWW